LAKKAHLLTSYPRLSRSNSIEVKPASRQSVCVNGLCEGSVNLTYRHAYSDDEAECRTHDFAMAWILITVAVLAGFNFRRSSVSVRSALEADNWERDAVRHRDEVQGFPSSDVKGCTWQ
jgi:hypothetical protein